MEKNVGPSGTRTGEASKCRRPTALAWVGQGPRLGLRFGMAVGTIATIAEDRDTMVVVASSLCF